MTFCFRVVMQQLFVPRFVGTYVQFGVRGPDLCLFVKSDRIDCTRSLIRMEDD
jgi:hypothetical protein